MSLVYAVCYCVYIGRLVGKETLTECQLLQLRDDLDAYYNKYHKWPDDLKHLLKQNGLAEYTPTDPISHKALLYFPDAASGTEAILVAQPEPFRTRLWPFGKMKRWVATANGELHAFCGEAALTLGQKVNWNEKPPKDRE